MLDLPLALKYLIEANFRISQKLVAELTRRRLRTNRTGEETRDPSARSAHQPIRLADVAGNKFKTAASDAGEAMLRPTRVLSALALSSRPEPTRRRLRLAILATSSDAWPPRGCLGRPLPHEGILTTLLYSDGSPIVLQSAGWCRICFRMRASEFTPQANLPTRTTRLGRNADLALCGREDDF